ncbi:MAG TPA: ABC transporter ATP-binding protein [Actinomycetota bacterium]|nr:ABC transporter ATP-binding protein [Actinomycetota bacterium]
MSSEAPARPAEAQAPPGGPTAIRAESLGKLYRVGSTQGVYRYRLLGEELASKVRGRGGAAKATGTFWALRNVSFEVAEGEVVGIIGRNGAGKSTLLKILSRITPPTEGHVRVRGRVGSLLEVGTGFHPELTGRENVFLSGAVLGMRKADIVRQLDQIVDFAGIERFLDTPIKRYSTGMYLRLAFAVAAHLETDILLVDEVLAVGDAEFQRKCLGRMAEIGATGRTVLFVSHSMPSLLRLCPRLILLDRGGVVADGVAHEVVRTYLESGLATAAERTWPSPDLAPGDDTARLKAVRVRTDGGEITDEIDIRRPVSIEVEYWHLAEDPAVRPSVNLHFYNEDGVCVFINADFNDRAWWQSPRRRGVVTATCRIPGNLLAEGRIYVTAVVSTYNPTVVHAEEKEAVAFQVVDRSSGVGDGVRGPFVGDWPGAVRPMLAWTIEPPPPAE